MIVSERVKQDLRLEELVSTFELFMFALDRFYAVDYCH